MRKPGSAAAQGAEEEEKEQKNVEPCGGAPSFLFSPYFNMNSCLFFSSSQLIHLPSHSTQRINCFCDIVFLLVPNELHIQQRRNPASKAVPQHVAHFLQQ